MSLFADATCLLLLFITFLYFFYTKKFKYWSERNVPFKEPSIPFGNLTDVVKGKCTVGGITNQLYKEFKNTPFFGLYSLWRPSIIVKDLDLIKNILIKDFDKFHDRPFASDENADPIAYHFLLGMKGERWKDMRSKLTPAFTTGKLKLMMPLINECGKSFTNYLKNNLSRTLEMKRECGKFATDVITSCAFGIQANSFQSEDAEFYVAGRKMFDPSLKRSLSSSCYFIAPLFVSLFKLKFVEETAGVFLKKVFWETMNGREAGKTPERNDLIDILLNLKKQDSSLMEGDILPAQAITFFAAGQETSSSAISFTLFELAVNPDVQERLRNEVLASIKENGDLTYEGVLGMKYMHMVVSEALRMYPFTPFISRVATADYKVPGHDLTIEKGIEVFIPNVALQKDPEYFPNPEKFDPERFNDENKSDIQQFAYLPFGQGPRTCIGERFGMLTVKTAIATILKDFRIVKGPTTPDKLTFSPTAPLLTAFGGVPVQFKLLD